jgi:hypothetical protein
MSTALAIAGVTQLLRDLLNDGLVDNDVAANIGTNVVVHARAPDLLDPVTDENSVLNVFLYKVDPQPNWANEILATRGGDGRRVANTPLALDLYYLISAASGEDLHADILLGHAMQILHEHPGFDRDEIVSGLNPAPAIAGGLPPVLQALAQTGLADQVEQLIIAPVYLGLEESSKLWTAFQTSYRSSMAYRVSSVIIAVEDPVFQPLPVLTIGVGNSGPDVVSSVTGGPPFLRAVTLPQGQPSARLGDTIVLWGQGLSGADLLVRFASPALDDPIDVPPDPGGGSRMRSVTIPNAPTTWAAGQFTVRFMAALAAGKPRRMSNSVALQIAPRPQLPAASVTRPDADTVQIRLAVRPRLRPGQDVELVLGDTVASAPPRDTIQPDAQFDFPALPAGNYPLRLRVDGVESWLVQREVAAGPPDFKPKPPEFDPAQVVAVPA